jgi:hypothetical protein
VSLRLPQGVLRFRTVGNCSSERRFGGIVCPERVEVNMKLDLFQFQNKAMSPPVSLMITEGLKEQARASR